MAQSTGTVPVMQPTETIEDFLICSICHGEMQNTATTSCGHRYCLACIGQWLTENVTCPCCNNRLQRSNLTQDRQFDSFVEIVKNELQKHQETRELKESLEAELTSLKDTLLEKDLSARQAQTKIKELEETIQIFKQETKRLKDEIAAKEQLFKKEKDSLTQKLLSARALIRETEQHLKETATNLENEQALSRKLNGDLKMSESNCQILTAHIEFLLRQNTLLQCQLGSLQQIDVTCRLLEEKITEIEEEKRELIKKNCKMLSENEALLQQKGEHSGVLMKSKHEISQLKQELVAAKERIKRIQENMKSLQMKNDGLKEDLYKNEQKLTMSRHFFVPEQ
ncbi:hypothetical protein ACJMK2_033212 [Sinanodonta woodiana]|uniref:RING-type domain-containing protein n=1 Tax=Sinanodonta woodiana TaxID=1069815 RepID=A0ABD3X423_SINWO